MIKELWNRLFKSDKYKFVNHTVLSKENVNLVWIEFSVKTPPSRISSSLDKVATFFKEKHPEYKVVVLVKYINF